MNNLLIKLDLFFLHSNDIVQLHFVAFILFAKSFDFLISFLIFESQLLVDRSEALHFGC